VTVWNDEERARQLAHVTWMANTAVLMYLNERATGDPARDWLSSWAHRWFVGSDLRVLVLGCGEGWLERAVAQWPFVARIDAVDFAEEAVARAREAARGMDRIHHGVVDLNRDELPAADYDVVVAHSVLHHVENLEHAFGQIERAMRPEATLVVNEYVGPNRFQFSDSVLAIMNALLGCLGLPPKQRPTVAEMLANDPTEAVRSEELLPFLAKEFEVLERKDIGGTILQHLLYETVAGFRFEVPRERSIVEMLCTIEAMLVDSARVPCDYVILAARKRGARVTREPRPLPPRPAAAQDVERDPLTWAGPDRRGDRPQSPPGRGGTPARHWRYALRMLRAALLSGTSRRANIVVESRLAEWRERFRARGTDPWTWVQGRAPDDPQIRCLLRTAATLAAGEDP
jgi:2-polyprenyl-3-methyl-5-hydroxy-6-metoxy-1,4-benzoquinol methylase